MTRLRSALLWWTDVVAARPWFVVLAAMLLAAASLIYALATLRLDTDTTDMIAADVPFRQHDRSFWRAFPEFTNPIVAVIEGTVPERVQIAATALADALQQAVDETGANAAVARAGSLVTLFHLPEGTNTPPAHWDDAKQLDTGAFGSTHAAALAAGHLLPPSQYEALFVSLTHDEDDCAALGEAVRRAFRH